MLYKIAYIENVQVRNISAHDKITMLSSTWI